MMIAKALPFVFALCALCHCADAFSAPREASTILSVLGQPVMAATASSTADSPSAWDKADIQLTLRPLMRIEGRQLAWNASKRMQDEAGLSLEKADRFEVEL